MPLGLSLPFKPRTPLPKNSAFGWRPLYFDNHTGVDFNGWTNAPAYAKVRAAGAGVVIESYNGNTPGQKKWARLRGTMVVIDHGVDADGVRWVTRYHMLVPDSNIEVGSVVEKGDLIGLVGNSGSSGTGAHCHFELWRNGKAVNPLKYLSWSETAFTSAKPIVNTPAPVTRKNGTDMLMSHIPAGQPGNPSKTNHLFVVHGPAYWNQFVGQVVANGYSKQIGAPSVPVNAAFLEHLKGVSTAGLPKEVSLATVDLTVDIDAEEIARAHFDEQARRLAA